MRIVFAMLLFGSAVWAQNAQISGIVQDPSGLSVSSAEVSVRNEQTGGRRNTQTNDSGLYSVPSLRPGVYRISIRAVGFETTIQEGVKLEIGDNARLDFSLRIGDSRTVVTVTGGPPLMNTENASVGTTIGRNLIDQMPLNGRGIQTLVELTPGVTTVPVIPTSAGQWTVNGQRSNGNYFTVDGVSANFAAGVVSSAYPNSLNTLGQAGSGSLPANNLVGNFSNLVSLDALQEFQIQTSTFAPEFGRFPGAQIGLVTRSGTNRYSGMLFEHLRNDATDANDWFNNQSGTAKPPLRFNDFGFTLGGPVRIPRLYDGHNRTFFFASFEDLLIHQPQPSIEFLVPTIGTRQTAAAIAAPLLNTLPFPNRPSSDSGRTVPGWAPFVGSEFINHNQQTYGLRVDHYFSERLTAFARYNFSPSQVLDRSPDAVYEADTEHYSVRTEMMTLGLTHTLTPSLVNEIRLNGSRQVQKVSYSLDGVGGAQQPASLFPAGYSANNSFLQAFIFPAASPAIGIGVLSNNSTRQLQAIDNLSFVRGTHQFKLGVDYRWLSPVSRPALLSLFYSFEGNALNGVASEAILSRTDYATYILPAFSSFVQDTWRIRQKLAITYGVRWEVNPAPRVNIEGITLREPGSLFPLSGTAPGPLYSTRYSNFAPRLGVAWQLADGQTAKTTLRVGAGVFYDLGQSGFENSLVTPGTLATYSNVPFGSLSAEAARGFPVAGHIAAAPGYNLPRTYQWNVTLEQSFGSQTFSAAYVGALGRRLVGNTTLNFFSLPDAYRDLGFVDIFGNGFSSSYHSMQLQFNRRLARRVQALISYTWSHAIDALSDDLGSCELCGNFATSIPVFLHPDLNRGPSDFDIRHSMNGAVLLSVPSPRNRIGAALLRNWTANSIFFARSAPPTDATTYSATAGAYVRPDVIPGQALYLYGSGYPGRKRYNPQAFVTPDGASSGDLGRNVLRGFSAWQIDFALHRQFPITDRVALQFRAEAFNIFNHPNFANPAWDFTDPHRDLVGAAGFGLSSRTLASTLSPTGTQGALSPLFQVGGARSLQFALRLSF